MERQISMEKLLEARANQTITITQAEYDSLMRRCMKLTIERYSLRNQLEYYESNRFIQQLLKKIF